MGNNFITMPRRNREESSFLLYEGGDEDIMANCCSCCSKTGGCCGAKCISISIVSLLIVYSIVTLSWDIYLAAMNENFGTEVASVYGVALAPAILALILFAYWLCCAAEQVE